MKGTRQPKYDGSPQGAGKNEREAAAKRWHVVKDGRLLAGSPTEAEAKRLAAYLGAEVKR